MEPTLLDYYKAIIHSTPFHLGECEQGGRV